MLASQGRAFEFTPVEIGVWTKQPLPAGRSEKGRQGGDRQSKAPDVVWRQAIGLALEKEALPAAA